MALMVLRNIMNKDCPPVFSHGRERGWFNPSYLTHQTLPFAENQRCHFSRADLGRGPPVSPHSFCPLGLLFQFEGPCWHSPGRLFLRQRSMAELTSCGPPFMATEIHITLQHSGHNTQEKLTENKTRNRDSVLIRPPKSKLKCRQGNGEKVERKPEPLNPWRFWNPVREKCPLFPSVGQMPVENLASWEIVQSNSLSLSLYKWRKWE